MGCKPAEPADKQGTVVPSTCRLPLTPLATCCNAGLHAGQASTAWALLMGSTCGGMKASTPGSLRACSCPQQLTLSRAAAQMSCTVSPAHVPHGTEQVPNTCSSTSPMHALPDLAQGGVTTPPASPAAWAAGSRLPWCCAVLQTANSQTLQRGCKGSSTCCILILDLLQV